MNVPADNGVTIQRDVAFEFDSPDARVIEVGADEHRERSTAARTPRRWRFCDVIGWPPSTVPTAPAGRISACFWMLPSIVLTNTPASHGRDSSGTSPPPSQLMLVSGSTCSTGRPVETAVASAVDPTYPFSPATSGRRDFESGSGQAERAEVRHVRRAVAGADAAGQDQARRRGEAGAGAERHAAGAQRVIRPQRPAVDDGRIRLLWPCID